jgi:hypothetical protein
VPPDPACQSRFSLLLANPVAAIRIPAALVAQLVEHLICNQGVAGSNPAGGTILLNEFAHTAGQPASTGYVILCGFAHQ